MVDFSRMSDAALWKLLVNDASEPAFDVLMGRHRAMIYGVCSRLLRAQDADDAFQMSILALLEHGHSIRSPDFGPWLYRVAYRASLRVRAERLDSDQHPEHTSTAESAVSSEIFDRIAQAEQDQLIEDAIDSLPESYREVVILHYGRGLRRDEIADRLNLTVATVKARLARGRQALRSRLVRRGVSLSAATLFLETLVEAAEPSAGLQTDTWTLIQHALSGEAISYSKAQFSDHPGTEIGMDLLRHLNPRLILGTVVTVVVLLVAFEAGRVAGSSNTEEAGARPFVNSALPATGTHPLVPKRSRVEFTPLTVTAVDDGDNFAEAEQAPQVVRATYQQSVPVPASSAPLDTQPSPAPVAKSEQKRGGLPEGEWSRASALGTVTFEIMGDGFQARFQGAGELASVQLTMQGEYATAIDGTVYGLIHGVDHDISGLSGIGENNTTELMAVTSMLTDLPFAMRVHSTSEGMTIKHLTVGIPTIAMQADMGGLSAYALHLCGRYTSQDH